MRPSPDWVLRRLRAMSVREVTHRTIRLLRHPFDLLLIRSGFYVQSWNASAWSGPRAHVFNKPQTRSDVDPSLIDYASALCDGYRDVLGLGRVKLPTSPWHFEPREGVRWPTVCAHRVRMAAPPQLDPRLTWEFNRGHEWVVLALAHAATGESRFLEKLEAEVTDWCAQNPVGTGINWASAMEAAIRIHSFSLIAAVYAGTPSPLLTRIGTCIAEHATFVRRNLSRFSSANNHLVVELTGLAVAGRILGEEFKKWHAFGLAELEREAEQQTFRDGVNAEMATHYHAFVMEALLLVAWLERAHAEPRVALESIVLRMASYVRAIQLDDGALLHQGDNDDGRIVPLPGQHEHALLALALDLESSASSTSRWLMPAGPEFSREARSVCFSESRQVVLRSGQLAVTLDAGPFGFGAIAAHAHCDALAIAVAIGGRRLLIDRGTYRYNGDPAARDAYRFTGAHNTTQVDRLEQGFALGPFLWGRRPNVVLERCELRDSEDIVVASHDGFAPHVHRRSLVRYGDLLLVRDEISPPRSATTRFHFAPEHQPGRAKNGIAVASATLITDAKHALVRWRHSDRYASETEAWTWEVECHEGVCAVVIAPVPITEDVGPLLALAAKHNIITAEEQESLCRIVG